MLEFIKQANEKIKKMNIWDISIMKIGLLFFGAIIGAHFDYFVKDHLLLFFVTWLLCATYLLWKYYRKDA